MTKKKITIKDVAKQSGVSITTVSQILNGKQQQFHPDTVKKVFQARDDLGYAPDYFARRMIMKKSQTIGIIVPDITNPFFATLVKGIEEVLFKSNFMTILCNVDTDDEKGVKALEALNHRGVDGLIVASSGVSMSELVKQDALKNIPVIELDRQSTSQTMDSIKTNDYLGGKLVAELLNEMEHHIVVALFPECPSQNILKRLEGFTNHFLGQVIQFSTELSKASGKKRVSDILLTDATAIFAANDEIAFGVYTGLNDYGKNIPEDYSVVGYDDIEMSSYVFPSLTTVSQPIFELGQKTANTLIQRIEYPEMDETEIVLPVKLIKRLSVAHT